VLYTPDRQQIKIDIAVTGMTNACRVAFSLDGSDLEGSDTSGYEFVNDGDTGVISKTLDAGKHRIRVDRRSCDVVTPYQFTVTGTGKFIQAPCSGALQLRQRTRGEVGNARRALRRARSKKARARAVRGLTSAKQHDAAAAKRVAQAC
jgi:hypothetical protein